MCNDCRSTEREKPSPLCQAENSRTHHEEDVRIVWAPSTGILNVLSPHTCGFGDLLLWAIWLQQVYDLCNSPLQWHETLKIQFGSFRNWSEDHLVHCPIWIKGRLLPSSRHFVTTFGSRRINSADLHRLYHNEESPFYKQKRSGYSSNLLSKLECYLTRRDNTLSTPDLHSNSHLQITRLGSCFCTCHHDSLSYFRRDSHMWKATYR